MTFNARRGASTTGAIVAAALAIGTARAASLFPTPQPDALPDGDGRDVVVRMCGDCHGVGPSVAKRHNRVEWQAIVDDMRDKGAPGSDDDAKLTVAYLTTYFGRVNVNTASAEALQRVLDLSPSDADAIVEWRASHPAFASIDDLKSVTGIDAAKIERGKNRIVFKGD
jgi:competence protein ComEA